MRSIAWIKILFSARAVNSYPLYIFFIRITKQVDLAKSEETINTKKWD